MNYLIHYNDSGEPNASLCEIEATSEEEARKKFLEQDNGFFSGVTIDFVEED